MKFGKQLQRAANTFPEKSYGDNLINYKALKKTIKRITTAGNNYLIQQTQSQTQTKKEGGGGGNASDSSTTAAAATTAVDGDSKSTTSPSVEFYDRYASQFSTSVERELSKINQFYALQIGKFQQQLQATKFILDGDLRLHQLSDLCESMNALRRYIVLNYLGVMKIVKKHDKNSRTPVAAHLIPLLYAQPFYYSNTVASLYTEVEVLYLKSPNLDEQIKNSRLDDYKCPICLESLESPVVLSCCHRYVTVTPSIEEFLLYGLIETAHRLTLRW
jgi:SPX domain protein involved in polyphosphate accumulation